MHFKYKKIFFGQNQSPNPRPSIDAIMSGLRPKTLSGHGPEESYPLDIFKIFLSPKLPLLSMWGSLWPTCQSSVRTLRLWDLIRAWRMFLCG